MLKKQNKKKAKCVQPQSFCAQINQFHTVQLWGFSNYAKHSNELDYSITTLLFSRWHEHSVYPSLSGPWSAILFSNFSRNQSANVPILLFVSISDAQSASSHNDNAAPNAWPQSEADGI